jgi:hypothetical protein
MARRWRTFALLPRYFWLAFAGAYNSVSQRRLMKVCSDVCSLRNRYQQSESRGIQKSPFSLRDCLCSRILSFGPSARLGPSCGTFKGGYIMLKMLTAAAASFAMLSAAAAADLPRRQPPPPAPAPVGKAPIGKYPVGKAPIGKYPTPGPVVTKG